MAYIPSAALYIEDKLDETSLSIRNLSELTGEDSKAVALNRFGSHKKAFKIFQVGPHLVGF